MKSAIVGILGSLAALTASGLLLKAWLYPYGIRTCALPCVMSALEAYANDHDGWYPNQDGDPYQSLMLLYPAAPPELLAGISGDRNRTKNLLNGNKQIDGTVSSWIYFPGFRWGDDRSVAIIWEKAGGIAFNGKRAEPGSHAVGFVDGRHEQMPSEEWPVFIQKQEKLRKTILAERQDD